MDEKVTGKQILSETATLLGHVGTYIADMCKQLVDELKQFVSSRRKKSDA